MLNYPSRLVRLVVETYPDVLRDVELETPLSAHPSWKARRRGLKFVRGFGPPNPRLANAGTGS